MRILTVKYSYTLSFIFFSVRSETEPIRVHSTAAQMGHALFYSLITLIFGWWSIPMGVANSLTSLGINLAGGEILADMEVEDLPPIPTPSDPKNPRPGMSWICPECHMVNTHTSKCRRCGEKSP